MDEKQFCRLELAGVLFTFGAAVALHFSYPLTNGAMWSILFGAVNESVWEHVKILTLPYLFWAIIERCLLRVSLRRMIIAKTAGLYFLAGATIVFYLPIPVWWGIPFCWWIFYAPFCGLPWHILFPVSWCKVSAK